MVVVAHRTAASNTTSAILAEVSGASVPLAEPIVRSSWSAPTTLASRPLKVQLALPNAAPSPQARKGKSTNLPSPGLRHGFSDTITQVLRRLKNTLKACHQLTPSPLSRHAACK
ncbi:hypothetical protein TRVL_07123 [Trypanosoma vivax]|nr:hypothetical protein TRVL_07123 [Trypanosoma vivax]